jgi:hypothetical protein
MLGLIEYVLSLNLPNGTTNPLVAQLRAAFRTTDVHVSCVKMRDFINMVAKDGGSTITTAEYSSMTDRATTIMDALGCSPAVMNSQNSLR